MPSIDIVVPTYNEERAIPKNIPILHAFAREHLKGHQWSLVIADNGSTDRSAIIARDIASTLPNIRVLTYPQAGRGRALSVAWQSSDADILSYMDVDLSSELTVLPALVARIHAGWDIAVGSRHLDSSQVIRSLHRSVLSQGYNFATRRVLGTTFSDAQCGIKALSAATARALLPKVRNGGWFFDTELLALAETLGYRIAELPVRWTEDSDSRVRLVSTVIEDIVGLGRLRLRDLPAARCAQGDAARLGAFPADSS